MTDEYKDDDMWEHYCPHEKTVMWVGKGEECNWCGQTEQHRQNDVPVQHWFKVG